MVPWSHLASNNDTINVVCYENINVVDVCVRLKFIKQFVQPIGEHQIYATTVPTPKKTLLKIVL